MGDSLTLSASGVGGAALPGWLSFDASTGTFSGTPLNADVGALTVEVTATDVAGLSATETFTLDVANTNDDPEVSAGIADQGATEDSAFTLVVPGDAFSDPDAGDSLTLSASGAGGAVLPDWLSFDASTGTFSGTPLNADVGALAVEVTATDVAGLSATETFTLDVANTNDDPEVLAGLVGQVATEGSAFTFVVPGDAFSDPDVGDSLTLSASGAGGTALPAWLSFDASTGTFSGTPSSGDVGCWTLK